MTNSKAKLYLQLKGIKNPTPRQIAAMVLFGRVVYE